MDKVSGNQLRITFKIIRACIFLTLIGGMLAGVCFTSVLLAAKWQGAPSVRVPQSTILYANDGSKLGETDFGEKRYWVRLKDINPTAVQAAIAVEDQNFYNHHGFDYRRMAAAALADIKAMAKVQGASTITQQYARNLYLEHDKTWKRKWNEAFYTIRLEQNYSKNEILEGYVNTIYYGHGAYGIEAASRLYFGKHAKDLNDAEAVLLAGIPKGPSGYSPYVSEKKAKQRQETILRLMAGQKMISKEKAERIKKTPLAYQPLKSRTAAKTAPYFYDDAMKELEKKLGMTREQLATSGLRVYTTLDKRMQRIAENTVAHTIRTGSDIQVGFSAIDPATGRVLALLGGRDYEKSPFDRATQAKRQPASTIKPLLYYKAIQSGFTPVTLMKSEATEFQIDDNGDTYSPSNYNGYYANKPITLLQALALSDNIYAVKTHLFLGMNKLVSAAKEFGISEHLKPLPSLALGTEPVRPIEMVNAYAMLANGGKQITPSFITKVTDTAGNILYEQPRGHQQTLDKKAAFVTASMMTGMFDEDLNGYTSVTGRTISDRLTRTYGGKSGTTSADSWMIGFNPALAAGVWTGYDKSSTIDSVEEKSYAKTIWADFMEKALEGEPEIALKPPKGVTGVYIDPASGYTSGPGCAAKHYTYFIAGTEPADVCYGPEPSKKEKEHVPARKEAPRKKWWDKWLGKKD
ncbi:MULTISPECIES: transglycosylase domain-containing protein [Bacillus]|uniref:transglycosylase domain-containing protein n=1 Tax=Bacillus TaxID=1386 RepID=UPI000653451E|nr:MULTISPECIES: transglycosylase domain-containing protein [Bacillus]KMN55406.1 penicillin-binding protein [Bacillus sp. LK7]MDF3256964.1 transglycosylase domain-containing protein [Bacillus velezensis]MDF3268777.1 transglycosylase domain-containing protein [Bacillus velezensis]QHC13492.1 PBP1A family penicillin-binding protein [Bacillus velezensis]QXX29699.1 penicillin-binding protein [Bacillus amyloliquefaciens]